MNLEIHYRYFEVGEPLVDELLLHVHRGESFVLLGYQGAGKRHALVQLDRRLTAEGRPHLSVLFRDNYPIVTERELLNALKDWIMHERCAEIVDFLSGATSLADWFHRLGKKGDGGSLLICFANLDWFADSLKEQLLALIRNSVQQSHIVVGLTGESLLARTLAGTRRLSNVRISSW